MKGIVFLLLIIFEFVFASIFSLVEISKELQQKLQEAHCEAECLDEVAITSNCQVNTKCSHCSPFDISTINAQAEKSLKNPRPIQLQLVCKDMDVISLKWDVKELFLYVLETRKKGLPWKYAKKTTCNSTTLNGLQPNTDYQFRLWGISKKGDLLGPLNSSWIRTFPTNYNPFPINQVSLPKLDLVGQHFRATINWKPAQDQPCLYHAVIIADEEMATPVEREVMAMDSPLQIEISDLSFHTNYSANITSRTINMMSESNKTSILFVTPTCLEVFRNLTICVPPEPQNLQSTEKLITNEVDIENVTYNVNVSWSKPDLMPDYYVVDIVPSIKNNSRFQAVSGNATYAFFEHVPIGIFYRVAVRAYSAAGESKAAYDYKELRVNVQVSSNRAPIIFGSLGGVLGLGVIVFVLLYKKCKFKKMKRQNETMMSKYYEGEDMKGKEKSFNISTEYYVPEIENDEFYLSPDQVFVGKLIGEGAFGVVHKGYLKKENGKETDVAIKMLKGSPSSDEVRQFEQEIEIMKSVGTHPHLVSMMGCCFKSGNCGPFLVVEYCDKGDLQTYLRAVWHQMQSQTSEMHYINRPNSPEEELKTDNHFSNKMYELFDDTLLEPRDLLSFARQISMGMEYLSNLRVVHRDLAARNVLMSGNRTVKVADFGLSRDVYQDNVYLKLGAGKLPVKWMAMESLSHQQYTTQSDVWSFGIVLWEIVTLGGNPYSTVLAQDLLGLLKSGYRMECPKNCSEELYEIMRVCWKEISKERPTFSELRKMLEKLLENENRYVSLDVRF